MVMPGDNVKMNVELIAPIAMEQGLEICYKRRWANSWRRSCVKMAYSVTKKVEGLR